MQKPNRRRGEAARHSIAIPTSMNVGPAQESAGMPELACSSQPPSSMTLGHVDNDTASDIASCNSALSVECQWTEEEQRYIDSLDTLPHWIDAERMLYVLLGMVRDDPRRRWWLAFHARRVFYRRLRNMNPEEREEHQMLFDEVKEELNHILGVERKRLDVLQSREDQQDRKHSPRRVHIEGSVSDFVRIVEAMRTAGIISRSTSVQQIVDLFSFKRSSSKSPEDTYHATLASLRAGHRARSSEFLTVVRELHSYLDREQIESLTQCR